MAKMSPRESHFLAINNTKIEIDRQHDKKCRVARIFEHFWSRDGITFRVGGEGGEWRSHCGCFCSVSGFVWSVSNTHQLISVRISVPKKNRAKKMTIWLHGRMWSRMRKARAATFKLMCTFFYTRSSPDHDSKVYLKVTQKSVDDVHTWGQVSGSNADADALLLTASEITFALASLT